uniref:C2H2-type domain-containing protein n=1 Tax=Zonotrichia albicollis TaxID=44394 RepID=A0A8D2MKZ4_ZONAL
FSSSTHRRCRLLDTRLAAGDNSLSYRCHRRNQELLLGAAGSGWSSGRAVSGQRGQFGSDSQLSGKQVLSATSDERVKDEFSDLSEGDFLSDDESEKRNVQSSDDSFEPYPEKKVSGKKSDSKEAKKAEEPKIRKKPGPKPGWKKKIKCEREELPTIYKCPYQGCTAVYRGADGMKKHIKEHHEEVRERPCPHPGCNKVFMIDRYLQRHVKLIHTEVRNYICDECGQTFKQRKHLSVHQMRHSGAKPLHPIQAGLAKRPLHILHPPHGAAPVPPDLSSAMSWGYCGVCFHYSFQCINPSSACPGCFSPPWLFPQALPRAD